MPTATRLTARNNAFLAKVKKVMNKSVYAKTLEIANEPGERERAARDYVAGFFRLGVDLDAQLDELADPCEPEPEPTVRPSRPAPMTRIDDAARIRAITIEALNCRHYTDSSPNGTWKNPLIVRDKMRQGCEPRVYYLGESESGNSCIYLFKFRDNATEWTISSDVAPM